ncbi:hypothetical protein CANTEDRAFT_113727, partial [Yamadazyma tenuis ATCC 10573]
MWVKNLSLLFAVATTVAATSSGITPTSNATTVATVSPSGVTAAPDTTTSTTPLPSLAHTASINGFADKIYDELPSCAQQCVRANTSVTPCAYWNTRCLCIMSNFGDLV